MRRDTQSTQPNKGGEFQGRATGRALFGNVQTHQISAQGTESQFWHGHPYPWYSYYSFAPVNHIHFWLAIAHLGGLKHCDVEKAKGNTQAARLNLEEAASIRPSPSVATRL